MQSDAFAAQRREQLVAGDDRLGPIVAEALSNLGADGWAAPSWMRPDASGWRTTPLRRRMPRTAQG